MIRGFVDDPEPHYGNGKPTAPGAGDVIVACNLPTGRSIARIVGDSLQSCCANRMAVSYPRKVPSTQLPTLALRL